ncbi:restriction endonuclease subunit S [Demequina sp.]|uniref:restriction endonuclease subunit S n=1 Tax=Demequina sp. TaxID=2050685 RepID=UPI003A843DA9
MTLVGEVLELAYGKALKASDRSGGDIPVVGSGGVVGGHDVGITGSPTIVVGRKGSIGSVTWIDGPAWPIDTAYYVKAQRPDIDLRWSYWMLRSLRMETMNKSAAIPGLNRDDVYRLAIDVPSLSEQQRIAAILDKADALRAKRRQVLAHLDDLAQAIFHDMFGRQDWPTTSLEAVCIVAGEYGAGVPGTEPDAALPRYLRITDIAENGRLNDDVRAPGGEPRQWAQYRLEDGDVLFARSGATVGKTYRYRSADGPAVFAGYLIRFRPDPELIDPDFLFGFTRTSAYSSWVSARQKVVAQPNINAKQYGRELQVPLPPLDRQREFARRTVELHRRRDQVMTAVERDDELFTSLQARAFRGEL